MPINGRMAEKKHARNHTARFEQKFWVEGYFVEQKSWTLCPIQYTKANYTYMAIFELYRMKQLFFLGTFIR